VKNIFISIVSIILIIMISFNHVYMAIARSIDSNSIKMNISNNLLSGFIYDDDGNRTEIFRTILELTTLDEDTVIRLMENDTVDRYLTDIVNSIYDYNLTGDSSYKYDGDYIINLVDDNIDQVCVEISYNLSNSDRSGVMNYLYNNIDYVIDTIYSTDIGGYTRND